ncbi:hypothetical protein BH11MYX1_BH11MYX1_01320 [soil metagenome]
MTWTKTFAGLLATAALTSALSTVTVRSASACGVKLALKYARPHRGVAKSGSPSHVLIVGSPPKRLEHDLQSAGHDVEVEADQGAAKRPAYDIVVVASNDQASEARTKFPDAAIVVRSGDIVADVRLVEGQAGRKPIRVAGGRDVIAAGPQALPVAAGSVEKPKVVAAREADQKPLAQRPAAKAPIEVKQPDAVTPVAEVKPPAPEPQRKPAVEKLAQEPTRPAPEVKQAPTAAVTSAVLANELYFGVGSADSNFASLTGAVRWLQANPTVNAQVEGFADPTGRPESNMELSKHRAEAVRDYLVGKGVDSSRLTVTPYGDTKLKYGHTDSRNRRVAIEAQRP